MKTIDPKKLIQYLEEVRGESTTMSGQEMRGFNRCVKAIGEYVRIEEMKEGSK